MSVTVSRRILGSGHKTNPLKVAPPKERWLDVGCGADKVPGAVGIDRLALPGVDVVFDLDQYPWPFESSTFDHVVCKHSISHLANFVRTVEEIHRITRSGGVVEILAPHYTSDNANTDPTMRTRVSLRTMHFFCEQYDFKYQYYSKARFFMERRWVSFRECKTDFRSDVKFNVPHLIGLEQLVNAFPRVYERLFGYILPASEVYFKLRVTKAS